MKQFVFHLKVLFQIVCRVKLDWNNILSEECLKKWRLLSNNVKQVQDVEISHWYGDLKVLLKLSRMVSRTLVYQVTVAAPSMEPTLTQ